MGETSVISTAFTDNRHSPNQKKSEASQGPTR